MSFENTIDCKWIGERIDVYLDGELSKEQVRAFESHARSCPGCASEIALARDVVSGLRSFPTFDCPDDVVSAAKAKADLTTVEETEGRSYPSSPPARLRNWTHFFGGRLAGVTAMLIIIGAVAVFVLSQRGGIEEQYTEAEIEKARREAIVAFAYVGKYTSRGATALRDEVMAERVVPTMRRALAMSGNEVMRELLLPIYQPPKKNVTNDSLEQSDK